MPAKGKGRCRFIDDDVDVSDAEDDDGEEEEGVTRRRRKRGKRAKIASSDEEEGDDVPTKEDLEFVVDDHVSEVEEEEEKVRISRKERRVGRDEMNLMLENVGLRTRRYKDEKKKVKTSVWKDDDEEDSVHTSDQGFVVDDDEEEEEEEEDDEAEEADEGEDEDGVEVDSAKDEDGETIATSSEAGSEDMSDPFVLDASNILSEALRFRRETAFESTSLPDVLGRMHCDGRWILSMDIMRVGIPSMFVEEFAARCVGCTVMSAKVIESLCVPPPGSACEFVRVSFASDGVPLTVAEPVPSMPIRAESPLCVVEAAEAVVVGEAVVPAPVVPAPVKAAMKPAMPVMKTVVISTPPTMKTVAAPVPAPAPTPGDVPNIFAAAARRIPVVPLSKTAQKKGANKFEPCVGHILRPDGTSYYRHEDGTIEERGRI